MNLPFCDFLGVTVPADVWDELRLEVSAELDTIGMRMELDDNGAVLWRSDTPDGSGTVKAQRRGKVWALGASGSVCAGLRIAGRFHSLLAAIGSRPHRVTRLDAALDVKTDAAPLVAEFAEAGRQGKLSLTRKGIRPGDVTALTSVRADGALSGTVYIGPRRGDARMVVYDKQHERMQRKLADVGPLTRYELRLRSRTGVTLRDAADPSGVFYHYASPDFLPPPAGMPPWVPGGSGFDIERTPPPLPYQRLLRRIEGSVDLRSLVALAESCGPRGVDFLVSRIRAMAACGEDARPSEPVPATSTAVDAIEPPAPVDGAVVTTH